MLKFDVAIVGSGPSGASAALKLAKAGFSTVVIEKATLPRYKVCGGGFVYRGRKNMSFDISEVVEKEFHTVDIYLGKKLHFRTEREQPIISMIMRDSFDHLIIQKAKEFGITLLEGTEVKELVFNDNGTTSIITTGEEVAAKCIIAADGAYSPIAKMAGWKEETRTMIPALEYEVEVSDEEYAKFSNEVRFDIDAVPAGYAWNFPKKNHLSIGVGVFQKKKLNLHELCQNYIEKLGIKDIKSISKHGFQIPVSPRTDGFVKRNVFLIGDAAGFADPITAEGISNAIYSGNLVAEAIIEAALDLKKTESLYLSKINEKLVPELLTSLKLSKWFYKHKTVRNVLLKKYGQRFSEAMADIFMGDRSFPANITEKVQEKVKELVF